ncbi:unnamed protein product [Notodromas monacha]|uniref:Lactate/malate dehydrogenase C-terminal domain-containing protein n=1 Tax=Notodromas monacha TaxID=399045 RepID=A0A7R9GL72_9CRUS|nr:unnamed protein product [Notodromas monacha]CAG0924615.1 unnamed protein product [Notodromas monacha]
MGEDIKEKLLKLVNDPVPTSGSKVTIVGVGQVGMACAFSILTQGYHGIEQDVFLSLPCVLGENGVNSVVLQNLSKQERIQLQRSASTLGSVQEGVAW